MREIKFRAWVEQDKRMITNICRLHFNKDGECYGLLTWGDGIFLKNDFILMQFTGLLDKNGKEIWEGDRIRFNYFQIYGYENVDRRAGFCIRSRIEHLKEGNYCILNDEIAKTAEVIGNIYEGGAMTSLKKLKKIIGHSELSEKGWKLTKIQKGFFKINSVERKLPVLRYTRERYITIGSISISVCPDVRYYNRLGRVL